MKIGIDCRMYSSQFTGIGRYVYELVENLKLIDNDNEYYLFFNHPEFDNFQSANKNFHKVLADSKHYSFSEQFKFLRVLNKYQLDLMHFTHFNAPILYNRPYIVTIHDLTLHFYPGKKVKSFLGRLAYHIVIRTVVKRAKQIIVVSRATGKDLQKLLKVSLNKMKVIYEGVNPSFKIITNKSRLENTKRKYNIEKPFLLYTGVWRDHKNIIGLLKAFKLIREKHDFQLIITGRKDSIYAEEIFNCAKSLGLLNQNGESLSVIFPGLVNENELIDLLNLAYIYVFPSFYEGFGLPPLEAMQSGTPVAVSNSSCIPEICGKNAVYFNPHSPKDMAKTIEALINDQELYQKLAKDGIEYTKKFSWSKMTKETLDLYKNFQS